MLCWVASAEMTDTALGGEPVSRELASLTQATICTPWKYP